MILDYKSSFKKSYRLLLPNQKSKVDIIIEKFMNNPFDLQLRNHKLKGKRIGCRSLDVMGDLRIIFRELSEGKYELVELIELGSHSQLY